MNPTTHPRQHERLAALESYRILDTERDPTFDEIVELAARICDAPISVINLIDDKRQWFKAEVGLGVRETPLETSLCAHVILQDEFVEINDTLADPRFSDNPLCLDDDGLRFYAGAQLIDPNGLPIGTLCVLDRTSRELTDLQRQALRVLSKQVMNQLELRRSLEQQSILRQEIDHRVKNSLQTVSSVIGLYARSLKNDEAVATLHKVKAQVESISALHAELQASSNASTVDLQRFLGRVCELLQGSAPGNVEVHCELEKLDVTSAKANALGIIANEFVANAIKHGFPEGHNGEVRIKVEELGEGVFKMTCSDNGLGSAIQPSAPSRADSIGKMIMQSAAMQIEGELCIEFTKDGTWMTLVFRND